MKTTNQDVKKKVEDTKKVKGKCWEIFKCKKNGCSAYKSDDLRCWILSGTHCRDEIQDKFIVKIEICLKCKFFKANIDDPLIRDTFKVINKQLKEFRHIFNCSDKELKNISMELSLGINEVFEALKKISSGDPTVRIKGKSKVELLNKLNQTVNMTAKEIGEIVDQSHEIAIGIAEHFDVLHRVTKGDMNARVTGSSKIELLDALKREINRTIESISREITKRKKAEEALRAREERFRQIAENSEEWIWEVDTDGLYIYSSPTVEKILGYRPEEIVGKKHFYDLFHHQDREEMKKRVLKGFALRQSFRDFVNRNVSKTGKTVWLSTSGVPILDEKGSFLGYRGADTDITNHKLSEEERAKLEAQLLQAQKMEAVGSLAGGLAHDFNNILTAIIGYGTLLDQAVAKDIRLSSYTKNILASAERAAKLTNSLLAFSRKQMISMKPINLNETVTGVEKLLMQFIGEDIEFTTVLTEEDLTIMADSAQIEQMLMNLATNARDAMPDGGSLLIKTERAEIDNAYIKAHGYGKPGIYVLITVEDTGHGMDKKIKEHIFDPFFTTKEVGKGTGLGLSMVYGLVKQHAGYITCYSEVGQGTIFKIYLPLIKSERIEKKPKDHIILKGGTETILVAEDDAMVRQLMVELLKNYGYTVIESKDGEETIRTFNENKDKIHLLILDAIMPKKNGKEVYNEIKKVRPDIKHIFSSGYDADIIHKKGIVEEGLNFISKPISPNVFLKKVREVLDI
jgi:PAS domain S-box-containing protein